MQNFVLRIIKILIIFINIIKNMSTETSKKYLLKVILLGDAG